MVRHRTGGWLQGFLCLTTFTHWQLWFQWNSLAPEAGLELGINHDGSINGSSTHWKGFGRRQRKLELTEHFESDGLEVKLESAVPEKLQKAELSRPVSRNSKAGRRLLRKGRAHFALAQARSMSESASSSSAQSPSNTDLSSQKQMKENAGKKKKGNAEGTMKGW